jgi:hypothetical protein
MGAFRESDAAPEEVLMTKLKDAEALYERKVRMSVCGAIRFAGGIVGSRYPCGISAASEECRCRDLGLDRLDDSESASAPDIANQRIGFVRIEKEQCQIY